MSIFGIISLIIIVFVIAFLFGLAGMAKYKNVTSVRPSIEKIPTKDTLYAERVIYAAVKIYCNFNESKIIRLGQQIQQKKDRRGEAIQEALNLVDGACNYFDLKDSEEGKTGGKIN